MHRYMPTPGFPSTNAAVWRQQMRFLAINPKTHEIEVVLKDFGHATVEADLDRHIEAALHVEGGTNPFECEVDIMGVRHAPQDQPNERNYRRIQRSHDLRRLKEESRWLPAMLDYYWRNGIGEMGVRFLESTEFVMKYRSVYQPPDTPISTSSVMLIVHALTLYLQSDLTYDTYEDAANPYGKSINAFKLFEGWRIQYLLYLVLASLLLSVCVVAMATAITKNFDTGLTTGSYALGLATAILAVLTFLSAVI
jgi:hypothetical protein